MAVSQVKNVVSSGLLFLTAIGSAQGQGDGNVCFKEGLSRDELELAIDYYSGRVAEPETTPGHFENLAECYLRLGKFEDVLEVIGRAKDRGKDFLLSEQLIGKVLFMQGRYVRAIDKLESVLIEGQPADYESWLYLGMSLRATGRLDEAEMVIRDYLDGALAAVPGSQPGGFDGPEVDLIVELSKVLRDKNDITAAEKYLELGFTRNSGSRRMFDAFMDFLEAERREKKYQQLRVRGCALHENEQSPHCDE